MILSRESFSPIYKERHMAGGRWQKGRKERRALVVGLKPTLKKYLFRGAKRD
jgi:hypothetical protein